MDPKGTVIDEWVDDVKIPGNPDSGKGKTYARHIIRNDGTETWEYRRYGSDQIVTTENIVNETQEKRWKDSQREAQRQTDQSERKVTRRYTGTDPATGKPAKVTEYETGSPSYEELPSADVTPPKEKDEGGRRYVWNEQTKAWEDVGAAPPNAAERAAASQDRATRVAEGNLDLARQREARAASQPTVINGKPYRLGADGAYHPVPVEGADKPPPTLQELKVRYGEMSQALRTRDKELTALVQSGELTQDQADKLYSKERDALQGQVNEWAATLRAQQSVYTADVAQANSQRTQANARLSASNNIMSNAVSTANASKTGLRGVLAGAGLGVGTAQALGGFAQAPTPEVPAALRSMLEIEIPGLGKLRVNPSGPQPAAPAATPPMPAAVPSMAPAPTIAPELQPAYQDSQELGFGDDVFQQAMSELQSDPQTARLLSGVA